MIVRDLQAVKKVQKIQFSTRARFSYARNLNLLAVSQMLSKWMKTAMATINLITKPVIDNLNLKVRGDPSPRKAKDRAKGEMPEPVPSKS